MRAWATLLPASLGVALVIACSSFGTPGGGGSDSGPPDTSGGDGASMCPTKRAACSGDACPETTLFPLPNAFAVAVRAPHLFATSEDLVVGGLSHCLLPCDTAPIRFVDGRSTYLALGPAAAFFAHPGTTPDVLRCELEGCRKAPAIQSTLPKDVVGLTIGGTKGYAIIASPTAYQFELQAGGSTLPFTTQKDPLAVTATADAVYFYGASATTNARTIWSCPAVGCTTPTLVRDPVLELAAMAAFGDQLYLAQRTKTGETGYEITRCQLPDCKDDVRVVTVPNETMGGALAVDECGVVWSSTPSGKGEEQMAVYACYGVACEKPLVVAMGQAFPRSIALDATSIYWANRGAKADGLGGGIHRAQR